MSIAVEHRESAPHPGAAAAGSLFRFLAGLRRQARRWIWIESLAWLALLCAAVFWGTLACDRGIEPPGWVRAAAVAGAVAGIIWLLAVKLVARLVLPLSDESLALVVERGHPEFRDSLSTAVGLARADRTDVDGALLARTTGEAVALLDGVEPARLFHRRRLCLLALAGAVAAGTIGLLAAVRPAVAAVWARRVVLLSDEPWPRSVQLTVDGFRDGVRVVARGSEVDVIVHADGPHGPPEVVELRTRGPAGWRTDRMGTRGGATTTGQTFGHVLEGVVEDTTLEIRAGDARLRNLRLHVVDAPTLESLSVRGTLPDYLGGGDRRPPAARIVALPRGSRVDIVCESTKPLSAATLAVRPAGESPAGEEERILGTIEPGAAGPPPRSISGTIESLLADATVVVRFTDTDGLSSREPTAFTLAAVPDEPPRVALRLEGISTAVTPHARLPLAGTIADDHGLADAAVRLSVGSRPARREAGGRTADRRAAADRAAEERTLPIARVRGGEPLIDLPADAPEVVPLDGLGLVPGGRLEVAVSARDRCTLDGEPQVGTSDTWTLDVVTPEELQALLEAREIVLRRRYEAAIDDFAQGRDRLAAGPRQDGAAVDDPAAAAARFGEAVARAAGETAELSAAFRGIRLELDNNRLLTPELERRLVVQIADPLAALAADDLAGLSKACRDAAGLAAGGTAVVVRRADEVLARMRDVLGRMMELESVNELIERLRGVIRTQEQIRAETLERQKRKAREALESP